MDILNDTTIPREIDDHMKRFGKEPWEVDYCNFDSCIICNTRIDEYGYCSCSAGAAD